MKLGIIILHWKNKALSLKVLHQLFQWNNEETVIVLVQNETEQDCFSEIDYPFLIKICSAKNAGFGGGVNLGIKALQKHEVNSILLLNPDIEIEESVVKKMQNHLQNNPKTFAVGPQIIETYEDKVKNYIGGRNIAKYVNTRIERQEAEPIQRNSISVDYIIGAVLMLNPSILQKTGYFDEDYFFSGEVADLCYRAIKKGFNCETLLNCKARHHLEEAELRNTLYKYYNFRNRFIFMRKHAASRKYLGKWYWLLFKELCYNIISLDFFGLKTMLIIIHHVVFNINGNQHHKFNL